MSWQAILGAPEQEAPIHSQNSHKSVLLEQPANCANSANVYGRTENAKGSSAPVPLASETDFEERASIIEHEARVPREWAEGYARLLCLAPAPGITPDRWHQIVDDGGRFLDQWADQANRLGWTTLEVFGVSPRAPEHRLDLRGLVPALGGHRVIMLTADAATIDVRGKRQLRIFRKTEDGAVPIWHLCLGDDRATGKHPDYTLLSP